MSSDQKKIKLKIAETYLKTPKYLDTNTLLRNSWIKEETSKINLEYTLYLISFH